MQWAGRGRDCGPGAVSAWPGPGTGPASAAASECAERLSTGSLRQGRRGGGGGEEGRRRGGGGTHF